MQTASNTKAGSGKRARLLWGLVGVLCLVALCVGWVLIYVHRTGSDQRALTDEERFQRMVRLQYSTWITYFAETHLPGWVARPLGLTELRERRLNRGRADLAALLASGYMTNVYIGSSNEMRIKKLTLPVQLYYATGGELTCRSNDLPVFQKAMGNP
jgi:hypothetical protein